MIDILDVPGEDGGAEDPAAAQPDRTRPAAMRLEEMRMAAEIFMRIIIR
jgi:hypothetical protein